MQRNSHYRIFSHPFFPRYFSAYNYAYDLNGNRIIDSRTGLEFTYNLLNLPCEVRDSQDNMEMRYTYLSDGTKVSALDAAGDGLLYRGNFVYEKDGQNVNLESIAWDEGRIRNKLFQALHYDEPVDVTDTLAVIDTLPGIPWHPKDPFFQGPLSEEGHWVEADTTELVLGPAIDRAPLYQDQWFVKDHLGNVRSVIDLTRSATMPADSVILEQNDYLPYGTKSSTSSLSTDSAFRYRYAGKEEQRFGAFDSQLLDFGARYYDPWSCQWTAVDPMGEKIPSVSMTGYCHQNPINRFDIEGEWDIKVIASEDRGAHPYATLVVSDRNGNNVYRTVVKTTGVGGRNRTVENSDTPTGKYTILEWRKTGNSRYSTSSFGPNDLLALDYQGGEDADGGNRKYMHLHGGRDQESSLQDTNGCMRINDDDIKEIKELTDKLESKDSMEYKGILTVENSSSSNVLYEDRERLKTFNNPMEKLDPVPNLPTRLK